ncbi:MAG: C-terminal binding protein [Chloroflexi bacterium]|nr:C-terminal binding protein [Chloroflexota bacterium]
MNKQAVLIDHDGALLTPEGWEANYLAQYGIDWRVYQCRSEQEVLKVARDAQVIIIQTTVPLLTRNVLSQLPNCRCTVRAGAGYDSIDYIAASELGIMVCYTPTYCTDEVADHAMTLLLAANRHVARLDAAVRAGKFSRNLAAPTEGLWGATVGIIGLGRIGSAFARRLTGWEPVLLAYDPYITQEYANQFRVKLVSLDELLERSDMLSVHCPLTPETTHLLDWAQFRKMKPGMVLVNTARGPIIHEPALVQAVKDNTVRAAGLDVFEQEPLPVDSPLFALDRVVLTPHISATSSQARHKLYVLVCELVRAVFTGQRPAFLVNPQVLERPRQP